MIDFAGDSQLKDEMAESCLDLQASTFIFNDAAQALKVDPLSSEATDLLIQSVRGLLHSTTGILAAYDMYDVRKIVALCDLVLVRQCFVLLSARRDPPVCVGGPGTDSPSHGHRYPHCCP